MPHRSLSTGRRNNQRQRDKILSGPGTLPVAPKLSGTSAATVARRKITERDYSLRHYLGEIIAAITLLESKALRSLWLVVSKPSFLSGEYFKGRRVRYVKTPATALDLDMTMGITSKTLKLWR